MKRDRVLSQAQKMPLRVAVKLEAASAALDSLGTPDFRNGDGELSSALRDRAEELWRQGSTR